MVKNSIVCAEDTGNRICLAKKFNKEIGKFEYIWGYYGRDNPNIYFTEEDAIELARIYSGQSSRKNVEIIIPLPNDEYYVLDFKSDEIKYFLKKAPSQKV